MLFIWKFNIMVKIRFINFIIVNFKVIMIFLLILFVIFLELVN